MDGRIVTTAEKMIRDIYHLSDSYAPTACSVNKKVVAMTMDNSLITLTVKIPASVVEERMEMLDKEEEEDSEEEPQEEVKEPVKEAPKKKLAPRK